MSKYADRRPVRRTTAFRTFGCRIERVGNHWRVKRGNVVVWEGDEFLMAEAEAERVDTMMRAATERAYIEDYTDQRMRDAENGISRAQQAAIDAEVERMDREYDGPIFPGD